MGSLYNKKLHSLFPSDDNVIVYITKNQMTITCNQHGRNAHRSLIKKLGGRCHLEDQGTASIV
jgi:hypothetical protein